MRREIVNASRDLASAVLSVWLTLSYSSCQQPTGVNQPVIADSTIYVIERDHLSVFADQATSGVFSFPVVNFHETYLINNSTAPVYCNVESPLPDTLKRESIQSPLFGEFAYIPVEYSDYFDVPNTNRDSLADKPNVTTADSYIWKNMMLGSSDGIHLTYSSYYGEESMFIKKLGTNHFLDMDVISDYSIQKDSVNPNYLDIEIKQTLQNTNADTIYRIGFFLFVPRELMTKFDLHQSEYTPLYNLISDTVISPADNKCYLFNDWHQSDGFGFFAGGQGMNPAWFILPPYQSYQFTYKMTIEPLLDKFEIYPSYAVNITMKGRDPIWPSSIITVNNKRFNGQVRYLRQCSLGMATYILFSIDNGTFNVVSPDDIVPTFVPPYIKPDAG